MQKIAGLFLLVLCFAALCLAVPLCWWLHDGMGPGMVETSGLAAVPRFLVLLGIVIAALSPVWGIALFLIKVGSRSAPPAQTPQAAEAGVWPPPPQTLDRKENHEQP